MKLDTRNLGVLLGAAILIGALAAPWYVLDLGAARDVIGAQIGKLPGGFGEFARELVTALPDKISADAWTVFERNDVVLLFAALAAALAALLDRHEVTTFIGAAAAGLIVVAMVSRPGQVPKDFISLSWGPWLALGGAALIIVASRIGDAEPEPATACIEVDWFARSAQLERERAAAAASCAPPA